MSCEKLCVFCVRFSLNTGDIDTFSESAGDMNCSAGHWPDEDRTFYVSGTDDSLRSVIHIAKKCKDYNQVKE